MFYEENTRQGKQENHDRYQNMIRESETEKERVKEDLILLDLLIRKYPDSWPIKEFKRAIGFRDYQKSEYQKPDYKQPYKNFKTDKGKEKEKEERKDKITNTGAASETIKDVKDNKDNKPEFTE